MSDFETKPGPHPGDFTVVPLQPRQPAGALRPVRLVRPDDLRLLAEKRRLVADEAALFEARLDAFEAAKAQFLSCAEDVIEAGRAILLGGLAGPQAPKPGATARSDGTD